MPPGPGPSGPFCGVWVDPTNYCVLSRITVFHSLIDLLYESTLGVLKGRSSKSQGIAEGDGMPSGTAFQLGREREWRKNAGARPGHIALLSDELSIAPFEFFGLPPRPP